MKHEYGKRISETAGLAADVREYTRVLTEMVDRHDIRIGENKAATTPLDKTKSNSVASIEDLVDARIALRGPDADADASVRSIADAHMSTKVALARLIERMDRRDHDGSRE